MDQTAKNPGQSADSYAWIAFQSAIVFIVLCGIAYPLLCTGLAQLFMPHNANGSLIKDAAGNTVGSELIGQTFTDPKYFQGRVSSIDNNGAGSGSNNYAPSNPDLVKRVQDSLDAWKAANPDVPISKVSIDLVTNSGSGLDPHISPESAAVQIPRISKLTGIAQDTLQKLVDKHTQGRDIGLFGEPRVNVLELNIDLQTMLTK